MPFKEYHSARISDPKGYKSFRWIKDKFGEGIDALFGIRSKEGPRGGKTGVQAIRFYAPSWSVAKAKKWLSDHEYKAIRFETATGGKEEKHKSLIAVIYETSVEKAVLLKKYKGYDIVQNPNGVIETVSPDGTRFIVGLDDSKRSGSRKSVPGANNVKTAEKYIDYAIKNEMTVTASIPGAAGLTTLIYNKEKKKKVMSTEKGTGKIIASVDD